MKKALLFAAFAACFVSCKKNNQKIVNIGTIVYSNSSKNPYKIYLDGSQVGTCPGNSTATIDDATAGSHVVRAVQESGYAIYPTTKEKTVNVEKGQTVTFYFP